MSRRIVVLAAVLALPLPATAQERPSQPWYDYGVAHGAVCAGVTLLAGELLPRLLGWLPRPVHAAVACTGAYVGKEWQEEDAWPGGSSRVDVALDVAVPMFAGGAVAWWLERRRGPDGRVALIPVPVDSTEAGR